VKIEVFFAAEKNPDLFSRIIMRVMRAPFSHVGLLINDEVIYDCVDEGFRKTDKDSFLAEHIFADIIDISKYQRVSDAEGIGFLEGRIGTPYAYRQLAGFLIPVLRGYLADGISKQVCSEAAMYCITYLTSLRMEVAGFDWVDPVVVHNFLKGLKDA